MERPLKAAILLFEENCWGLQAHKCNGFLTNAFIGQCENGPITGIELLLWQFSKKRLEVICSIMAAFGSVARQFTRRGVFRTVRDFSLGSTSRTSVAVVSTI